jgi:hypothetical protein
MSLGFRVRNDHNAERRPPPAPLKPPGEEILPVPSTTRSLLQRWVPDTKMVSSGIVKTFAFSSVALVFPLLFFYNKELDVHRDFARGGVIGGAALLALALVVANDCKIWYNMALFFHIGIETKVLHVAYDYATASSTGTTAEALAWVGFGVVIAHLLPFLFFDHAKLLVLLAAVGVPVNAALLLFTFPKYDVDQHVAGVDLFVVMSPLLLVIASSSGFLAVTLHTVGRCGEAPSMLATLRASM